MASDLHTGPIPGPTGTVPDQTALHQAPTPLLSGTIEA